MLFHQTILPNGTKLGIWKIEESTEELMTQLSAKILTDSRYQSITNTIRKQEFLCSRLLIKTLCGKEKKIYYDEEGKPSVSDNTFCISISHTKGYVAVILHPSQSVGIDIEHKSDRILKLKEKFMHTTELAAIDITQESLHTLLHWSAKETLFKILHEVSIDFIEHLHIKPFIVEEEGSFEAFETRTQKKQEFTIQYEVYEDFVLTWCTK